MLTAYLVVQCVLWGVIGITFLSSFIKQPPFGDDNSLRLNLALFAVVAVMLGWPLYLLTQA